MKIYRLMDGVPVPLEDGEYLISLSVGDSSEPPADPTPDPEPGIPPSVGLPSSIADAQSRGLLPRYRDLGVSVRPATSLNWSSMAGDRDEIGYLTEQTSAYLAGHLDLEDNLIEMAKLPVPDRIGTGRDGQGTSHMPNAFWVPFLLTGDKFFVRQMERIYPQYMAYFNRNLGANLGSSAIHGRYLAWCFLNLFQLAWAEKQGYTEHNYYIETLEKSRDTFMARIDDLLHEMWRVLQFNRTTVLAHGWTGWFETHIGIVLCRAVAMGFDDWRPIAEWHYEHILRRSGDRWKFKDGFSDHVNFRNWNGVQSGWTWAQTELASAQLDWDIVQPWPPSRMALPGYTRTADNDIIPVTNQGVGFYFTYPDRANGIHMWHTLAAEIGIPRALEKEAEWWNARERTTFGWNYRHALMRPLKA